MIFLSSQITGTRHTCMVGEGMLEKGGYFSPFQVPRSLIGSRNNNTILVKSPYMQLYGSSCVAKAHTQLPR